MRRKAKSKLFVLLDWALMDVDSISPDGLRCPAHDFVSKFRTGGPFHLPCTTRFQARDGGPRVRPQKLEPM